MGEGWWGLEQVCPPKVKEALQDESLTTAGTKATTKGRGSKASGSGKAGAGQTTEEPPETPEAKARKALIEAVKTAVTSVRSTNTKIDKDLKEVDIVVARLRMKKWDTSGPREFLLSEAAKVKEKNNDLWGLYLKHKDVTAEANVKDMSDQKLHTIKKECEDAVTEKGEMWKAFAKNTLNEFAKMK